MKVTERGNSLSAIRHAMRELVKVKCYVGVPLKSSSRNSKSITNAELAFIHSKGSERLNIPARPFIEPAIEKDETQHQITRHMKAAVLAALEGQDSTVIDEVNKAGQAGENAAKDYIQSGNLAPNSGFTLNGGWMRNRISGKPFYAKPKKSAVPLIDTGSLRSSITHVVEKR